MSVRFSNCKYGMGEKVKFMSNGVKKTGVVEIVDPQGTWGQGTNEPSYNIFVEEDNTLYKHFVESLVSKVEGEDETNS